MYADKMAGKGRFRIPTAKEMEVMETSVPKVQSYFKRVPPVQSHKPTETKENITAAKTEQYSTKIDHLLANSPSKSATGHTLASRPQTSTGLSKSEHAVVESSEEKATLRKDAPLQPIAKSTKANCVVVNPRQRGNPIIKHIRNIPWEFGDTPADYELGKASCALYLSIRYHQLNPEYIHDRLKKLGRSYDLRVMLVQVDVKDPHHALKELAKICILADFTLILAFSQEEAGRYLETYKIYENKPPDAVMEKTDENFLAKFTDCLTSVKSVNKTDCMTLLTSLGSYERVSNASVEDLSLCPGFGPQKAQRLHNTLHEPFCKDRKRKAGNNGIVESTNSAVASTSKKI